MQEEGKEVSRAFKNGPGNAIGTVYIPRESITTLNSIQDRVGNPIGSTEHIRDCVRIKRLAEAKAFNSYELNDRGKVSWIFALVETKDGIRTIKPERREMTQKVADLKNKTMTGTGRQWCRIER